MNCEKHEEMVRDIERLKSVSENHNDRIEKVEKKADVIIQIATAVDLMTKQHERTTSILNGLNETMQGFHVEQQKQGTQIEHTQQLVATIQEKEDARMIDPSLVVRNAILKYLLPFGGLTGGAIAIADWIIKNR